VWQRTPTELDYIAGGRHKFEILVTAFETWRIGGRWLGHADVLRVFDLAEGFSIDSSVYDRGSETLRRKDR